MPYISLSSPNTQHEYSELREDDAPKLHFHAIAVNARRLSFNVEYSYPKWEMTEELHFTGKHWRKIINY